MTLEDAVRAVFDKHPDLADRAIVERYPNKYSFTSGAYDAQAGVFAYQFMSTAGLNIATYIPEVANASASGGLQFQDGPDGRGRPYDSHLVRESEDISRFKHNSGALRANQGGIDG